MSYYIQFLKAFGFRGLISEYHLADDEDNIHQHQEVTIEVDRENNVTINTTETAKEWYRYKPFRFTINTLYVIIILLSLTWSFIYAIVLTVRHREWNYVYSNVFTLAIIIQYFAGWKYNQSNHFIRIARQRHEYHKRIYWSFMIGVMASVSLAIVSVALLVSDANIIIYGDIYANADLRQKIFTAIALFIDKFYSYNIFFTNMITFATVFTLHSIDIEKYASTLEGYVDNNEGGLTIDSITKEYAELKSHHAKSVTMMNTVFSSITILGAIALYFLNDNYGTKFAGPLFIVDFVCFLIIECSYIFVITKVKGAVSSIISIINSPEFTERYLSREELVDFEGDAATSVPCMEDMVRRASVVQSSHTIDALIRDIGLRNMIKSHENAEGIDWMILSWKLSGPWENFQIMGFDIEDTTIIQRAVAGIMITFAILHVNANSIVQI